MPNGARIRITRVIADAELAEQVVPKMRNLINAVHRRAALVVPKRTWNLHDTLTTGVEVEGSRVVATLGVGGPTDAAPDGARYWDHVERGTSKAPAQPYMRPALMQSKARDLNDEGAPPSARGGR